MALETKKYLTSCLNADQSVAVHAYILSFNNQVIYVSSAMLKLDTSIRGLWICAYVILADLNLYGGFIT